MLSHFFICMCVFFQGVIDLQQNAQILSVVDEF